MSTQCIKPETNIDSVEHTHVLADTEDRNLRLHENPSRLHTILADHMLARSKKPIQQPAKD